MENTTAQSQKGDTRHEITTDSSIKDARWMLASVVLLAMAVMSLGLFAESVSAVQASNQTEISQK